MPVPPFGEDLISELKTESLAALMSPSSDILPGSPPLKKRPLLFQISKGLLR